MLSLFIAIIIGFFVFAGLAYVPYFKNNYSKRLCLSIAVMAISCGILGVFVF